MAQLIEKFLKKIAHFQVESPYLTVLILLVLTMTIWGGVSLVKTVSSLEKMMPSDVEEIKAFNVLRDNNLGQDMIAIILQVNPDSLDSNSIYDVRDERVYTYLGELRVLLESEPDVLKTYSLVDVVDFYNLDSSKLVEGSGVYDDKLSMYVNSDYSLTMMLVRTDVSADDMRMGLLADKIKGIVNDKGHPSGVNVKFTGTPVIQQKLGELISKDRVNTQWISTFLVFLITALIFRSLTSAIVPILVVFMSVNWLYGTMGYTSLPISTLAGGVAAMVIGIGIDFAIHIMNKFKYDRKLGQSIPVAIENAVTQTGMALIATSVTTIVAFLAFTFGIMPEMGRFGILMAIGITYSLIFSIFGLPALLIIEERFIYWIKKNFRFGIEGELHLEGGDKK